MKIMILNIFGIFVFIGIVSTAAVNDNSTRGDCPDGWLDASFVDLGCLLFQHEDRSWWDNLMNCREKNSYLLEVFTEPQLDFIRLELQVYEGQYGQKAWYVGASDEFEEGNWYWITSWQPVDQFNWASNQPSSANYLCYYYADEYLAHACQGGSYNTGSICQMK